MFLPLLNTSPFIFLAFHVLENLSGAASTQISLKKLFAQIFKTRSRSGWASGLEGCPGHLRGPFREHPGLGMWASPNPAGPFTTKPRLQASQSTTFALVAEPSKKMQKITSKVAILAKVVLKMEAARLLLLFFGMVYVCRGAH